MSSQIEIGERLLRNLKDNKAIYMEPYRGFQITKRLCEYSDSDGNKSDYEFCMWKVYAKHYSLIDNTYSIEMARAKIDGWVDNRGYSVKSRKKMIE